MASPSPPKPYELNRQSSSTALVAKDAAGSSEIAVTTPAAAASTLGVQGGNFDGSLVGIRSSALTPYSTSNSSYGYGSRYGSYGGYGSGYGSGYGAYGGYGSGYGAYGGSSYGSGYGGYGYGGYGGGYGRYGGGMYGVEGGPPPPWEQFGIMKGANSIIQGVESHVQSFGRISELLHMNFEALHMSFSSFLRLITNVAILKHEMWTILGSVTSLKFLHIIYLKLRRFLANITGSHSATEKLAHDYKEAWEESKHSNWAWIPFIITVSLAWWVLRVMYRLFRPSSSALLSQTETLSAQAQAPTSSTNVVLPNGQIVTTEQHAMFQQQLAQQQGQGSFGNMMMPPYGHPTGYGYMYPNANIPWNPAVQLQSFAPTPVQVAATPVTVSNTSSVNVAGSLSLGTKPSS